MKKPTTGTMRKVAVLYFVALLLLMWLPLNGVVALDNYVFGLRADHLLHASVYLPCIYFLGKLVRKPVMALWLLSVGIGLLTEGVQYLLPYRGFDVNDLLANAIGVSLGLFLFLFFLRKKSFEKKKTNGTID
ncbi:MAG: VanZ family protein [Bacteroidales bacterium]|nr:VanZ family protein [Bacteroidales bacterium]MCR5190307.1 VanZ family protein [Bacteroidales bacterium]